jgi:hypothetical protein
LPTAKEMIVERPYTAWKAMQAFNWVITVT